MVSEINEDVAASLFIYLQYFNDKELNQYYMGANIDSEAVVTVTTKTLLCHNMIEFVNR